MFLWHFNQGWESLVCGFGVYKAKPCSPPHYSFDSYQNISYLMHNVHVFNLKALKQAPSALWSTNSIWRAGCRWVSFDFLTKFIVTEKYNCNCDDISLKDERYNASVSHYVSEWKGQDWETFWNVLFTLFSHWIVTETLTALVPVCVIRLCST